MTIKEIAWLAGIIEGEGHLSLSPSPTISISMIDEDIIKRISKLFKRPYNLNPKAGSKMQYRVNICGTPAIEMLFTIYSFLGARRKFKALELINEWKNRPIRFRKDVFGCGDPKTPENTYRYGRSEFCKKCSNEKSRERQQKKRLDSQLLVS